MHPFPVYELSIGPTLVRLEDKLAYCAPASQVQEHTSQIFQNEGQQGGLRGGGHTGTQNGRSP